MLLVLTGAIQSGKTRWLQARVAELAARGVPCRGVVAPGVWREAPGRGAAGGSSDASGASYEKLGIENVLLPGGERVRLARPAAPGPGLAWEFDAAAMARVNAHLRALRAQAQTASPGLLVVDELGPLELRRHEGLVEAVAALAAGPAPAWPHALVVVRAALAGEAAGLLGPAWGGARAVRADEAGAEVLREVLLAGR